MAAVLARGPDAVLSQRVRRRETDSRPYHETRSAFEDDRARDAIHTRAGYRTLRFTDHQLETEPRTAARTVEAALAERTGAIP
jgi:very-short-patch-repair endonuclease